MKGLLLLSFICLSFAFDLNTYVPPMYEANVMKRSFDPNLYCFNGTCIALGQYCTSIPSTPCYQCYQNWTSCFGNATNSTQMCQCYSQFTTCTNGMGPYCSPNVASAFSSCVNSGLSCCGTIPAHLDIPACHLPTTYCDSINTGKCQSVHKTGSCLTNAECGDPTNDVYLFTGSPYLCQTGQCTFSPSYVPGVPCQQNGDCLFNNCTNGICVGSAIGQSCVMESECYDNAFCHNGICTAHLKIGQNCSNIPSGEQPNCCEFGASCQGVCTAWFTAPNGAPCVDSNVCEAGNSCVNGICGPSVPKNCNTSLDCTGNSLYTGECQCTLNTLVPQCEVAVPVPPSACDIPGLNYVACIKNNTCGKSVPYTCCQNEYNCYFDCVITAGGLTNFACGNLPTCVSATSTSSSGTGSSGIATGGSSSTSSGVSATSGSGTSSSSTAQVSTTSKSGSSELLVPILLITFAIFLFLGINWFN